MYEVELIDTESNSFTADHTIITNEKEDTIEKILKLAWLYWNPKNEIPIEKQEILTMSSIRIIRRVDPEKLIIHHHHEPLYP